MSRMVIYFIILLLTGQQSSSAQEYNVDVCDSALLSVRKSPKKWSNNLDDFFEIRESWRAPFSNPLNQKGQAFKYLVRAIDFQNREVFYRELDRINKNLFISSSLIFPGHLHTFFDTPTGFILEFKPENIIASNAEDFASYSFESSPRKVRELAKAVGLHSPQGLIEASSTLNHQNSWNEVLLENKAVDKVRAVAIFIFTDLKGAPLCSFSEYEILKKISVESGMTIIEIPKENNT